MRNQRKDYFLWIIFTDLYRLHERIDLCLLKTVIFFKINVPFYSWHRRPLNKAVTPPRMNCTSVTETAQWGRTWARRSRARNRVCMRSHSRDRLDGDGGGGARASLQFRALVRKPATPTPVVERLMIPYAKLATWQKVGQSARCGPWGRSEAVRDERKGGRLWAFFPHFVGSLLDSTCLQKYRREQERRGGMITCVFLTQKARKPTPKYDEHWRAL